MLYIKLSKITPNLWENGAEYIAKMMINVECNAKIFNKNGEFVGDKTALILHNNRKINYTISDLIIYTKLINYRDISIAIKLIGNAIASVLIAFPEVYEFYPEYRLIETGSYLTYLAEPIPRTLAAIMTYRSIGFADAMTVVNRQIMCGFYWKLRLHTKFSKFKHNLYAGEQIPEFSVTGSAVPVVNELSICNTIVIDDDDVLKIHHFNMSLCMPKLADYNAIVLQNSICIDANIGIAAGLQHIYTRTVVFRNYIVPQNTTFRKLIGKWPCRSTERCTDVRQYANITVLHIVHPNIAKSAKDQLRDICTELFQGNLPQISEPKCVTIGNSDGSDNKLTLENGDLCFFTRTPLCGTICVIYVKICLISGRRERTGIVLASLGFHVLTSITTAINCKSYFKKTTMKIGQQTITVKCSCSITCTKYPRKLRDVLLSIPSTVMPNEIGKIMPLEREIYLAIHDFGIHKHGNIYVVANPIAKKLYFGIWKSNMTSSFLQSFRKTLFTMHEVGCNSHY